MGSIRAFVLAVTLVGSNAAPVAMTAPVAPTLPQYAPMAAEMRPLLRQGFAPGAFDLSLRAAPEIQFVGLFPDTKPYTPLNSGTKREAPKVGKIVVAPPEKAALGTEDSVKDRFGTRVSSNGRRTDAIYGDAAIPEVGERPKEYADTSGIKMVPEYKPGPAYANFGNDRYELLKNKLAPEVVDNFDQKAGSTYKQGKALAETDATSISSMALISLFVGSGLTLAVVRFRRASLTLTPGPLLG